MCGICGQFSFKADTPVNEDIIRRMTAAMVHRGPDDEGCYLKETIGLGFRRLSIIDLASGKQPMFDKDKTVCVIHNGEIYNFPELRKELEKFGHTFQTNSDTEVIVYGYKQWGMDVLEHLNGMFGLAIWDIRNKRLMLARDRMGIKPLYYHEGKNNLFFCSEIKGILSGTKTKPAVDPVAFNLFLRYRYTPAPLTIFQGIRKLAPGTRLIVENNQSRVERWWNFKPVPFDPMPSIKEAEEELLETYKRALKRHLISDVPLGLLLSGGLDSGLLLALMNLYGKSWKSYTIGFGSKFKDDEISAAAHTAEVLHAPHHTVQLNRDEFEATLPMITSLLEEPIASSSIVPMYHICKRAAEDVKVVLMGQGPDELFGGYKRHLGALYGHYWRSLPAFFRKPAANLLALLPRNEMIKRALYSLDIPERMKRYQMIFSLLPAESVDSLFQDDILPPRAGDQVLDFWSDLENLLENTDEMGGLQFLEIRSSLPDELMMYADKLSMAHSLEIRVPYLDQEVVEYAERLSSAFKVRHFSRKWLHRRVCKKFLPADITNRKKLGFQTPVDEWFRNSIDQKLNQTLLDNQSLIYGYLRSPVVRTLIADHRSGKANNYKIIFSLIVMEEWMRNYLS